MFRQITSNSFQTCSSRIAIYINCMNVLWQRFWLDLCTKQVVSARACAYRYLPYNSSGIDFYGKRTVQADSCLHSEQSDTLFVGVGSQEGGFGGWMVIMGRRPKIDTWLSGILLLTASQKERGHSAVELNKPHTAWSIHEDCSKWKSQPGTLCT